MNMWPGIIVLLTALSLSLGCASSPYVGTGAAIGGGVGALTGAAINNRNPWAGAAVGGLIGSAVGAAGGYAVSQRQTTQQPQGYYYQPAPGYSAPPPQPNYGPNYGYNYPPPAPGPSYGGAPPAPGPVYSSPPQAPGPAYSSQPPGPGPAYSSAPAAEDNYSQLTPPQPEGCRAPMKYTPYYY